jgi:hypothetical protein
MDGVIFREMADLMEGAYLVALVRRIWNAVSDVQDIHPGTLGDTLCVCHFSSQVQDVA